MPLTIIAEMPTATDVGYLLHGDATAFYAETWEDV